jgi:hypothetical protein
MCFVQLPLIILIILRSSKSPRRQSSCSFWQHDWKLLDNSFLASGGFWLEECSDANGARSEGRNPLLVQLASVITHLAGESYSTTLLLADLIGMMRGQSGCIGLFLIFILSHPCNFTKTKAVIAVDHCCYLPNWINLNWNIYFVHRFLKNTFPHALSGVFFSSMEHQKFDENLKWTEVFNSCHSRVYCSMVVTDHGYSSHLLTYCLLEDLDHPILIS